MSSDRVGGLPPPSEPSRGGSAADSKKFREELQKVQKVKAVDPDEQSRKKNKRFAAMMGDEDVADDLNASPRVASPFEVTFHSTVKPVGGFRSGAPRSQNPVDSSTSSSVPNTAVPSPAYSQPPTVEPTPTPRPDGESSSSNLPSSGSFWGDVELPDGAPPPPRQNFQETAQSQNQQQNSSGKDTHENPSARTGSKKKKPEVEVPHSKEKASSPFGSTHGSEEETKVSETSRKKGKEPVSNFEEEEFPTFGLQGQKVEGSSPVPKKGMPLDDEEDELTQYELMEEIEEEEKAPSSFAPPPGTGKEKKETLPEKGEFIPLSPSIKKEEPLLGTREPKEAKKKEEPSPWVVPPKTEKTESAGQGKKTGKSTELPFAKPDSEKKPIKLPEFPFSSEKIDLAGPKKETKKQELPELPFSLPIPKEAEIDFEPPEAHPSLFKEKEKSEIIEESLLPPLQAPMAPSPFIDKVDRKSSAPKGEAEAELIPDALVVPLEKSGEREGGRGGKGHSFEHTVAQIQQPALPHFPPNIQPMAQAAAAQATPYLTPETMALFYQMVGTIYIMTAPTGISRTEIVLDAPSYANSKFFGSTITIEKYATAPDSLNIRLTGSNEAVQAFNQNATSLVAAFQNGNFKFRIGRIDAAYTVDKPVFRRKERGEGKDSGDFEGRKR